MPPKRLRMLTREASNARAGDGGFQGAVGESGHWCERMKPEAFKGRRSDRGRLSPIWDGGTMLTVMRCVSCRRSRAARGDMPCGSMPPASRKASPPFRLLSTRPRIGSSSPSRSGGTASRSEIKTPQLRLPRGPDIWMLGTSGGRGLHPNIQKIITLTAQ